jgi:hypothetical protein
MADRTGVAGVPATPSPGGEVGQHGPGVFQPGQRPRRQRLGHGVRLGGKLVQGERRREDGRFAVQHGPAAGKARAAAAGPPRPNRRRRPGSAGPRPRTTPPPRSARRAAAGRRGPRSRRAPGRWRRWCGPSPAWRAAAAPPPPRPGRRSRRCAPRRPGSARPRGGRGCPPSWSGACVRTPQRCIGRSNFRPPGGVKPGHSDAPRPTS